MAAYNDQQGITKAFNLNLLNRLNNELNTNFNHFNFDHFPTYNPHTQAAESFLISLKKQTVNFPNSNRSIDFDQWELIHTEISQKFTLEALQEMTKKANYHWVSQFYDCKNYFIDVLLKS